MYPYAHQQLKCKLCPIRSTCPLKRNGKKLLERDKECTWLPFAETTPESIAFKKQYDKEHKEFLKHKKQLKEFFQPPPDALSKIPKFKLVNFLQRHQQ